MSIKSVNGFSAPFMLFLVLAGGTGYALVEYGNIIDADMQRVIDQIFKTGAVSRKDRLKALTTLEQQTELSQELRSNLGALDGLVNKIVVKTKKQSINKTKSGFLNKLFNQEELTPEAEVKKLIVESQQIINELDEISQNINQEEAGGAGVVVQVGENQPNCPKN